MSTAIDLTGQRFGRLTAVEPTRASGRLQWICSCECGGSATCDPYHLRSGNSKSCGCLQREQTSKAKSAELIGQVFGLLTVISRAESGPKRHAVYWDCICECGRSTTVNTESLRKGDTRSCGCLHGADTKEMLRARLLRRVDVSAETGCWIWTGPRNRQGYGKVKWKRKTYGAHRLVAHIFHGLDLSLGRELVACHHCDNPPCVNPDHIFLGTLSDNTQDSVKKKRQSEIRKTHCAHGHEYTAENTRMEGNKRRCRACEPLKRLRKRLKLQQGIQGA